MKSLYGEAYAKHLSGLAAKIGGYLELYFTQRMANHQEVKEVEAALLPLITPRKANAVIRLSFTHGKTVELKVYAPRLLEIGCNTGQFLAKWAKDDRHFGWGFFGADVNDAAVKNAEYARITVTDMQAPQFEDASFANVLARHVLEHVPNPEKGLEEVIRVTEPGGIIALTYPYEPVRGLMAIPSAIASTGNPFDARKLHLHALTPDKVFKMLDTGYLQYARYGLKFVPMPVWVHLLVRNAKPYDSADYTPLYRRSFARN